MRSILITNFSVLFLPPNCTALLQPMDQNLIQNIKVSYRKGLLNYVSHDDGYIVQLLKIFKIKNAVTDLDRAWKSITEKNMQKLEQIVEEALNRNHEDDEDEPYCVEEENIPRIEHVEAIKAFKVCEQWAEENGVDLNDILLLKRLKETAENFIIRNKKKQTKIDTF
ncbi:hypothetical protein NQ314_014946 [Rhamnusium bicolor]|uniref:DDE-1 domain-containing protein n=1 Tax=Rhamnusium bicolor TaxID=1586634 RepID=A0AAV8X0N6_9CUCU|nr:hypothetical protein NQ314_014946 [Rhamnusium bicolor]